MALISCSECRKPVSDKASFCPHCGNPDILPINHSSTKNQDVSGILTRRIEFHIEYSFGYQTIDTAEPITIMSNERYKLDSIHQRIVIKQGAWSNQITNYAVINLSEGTYTASIPTCYFNYHIRGEGLDSPLIYGSTSSFNITNTTKEVKITVRVKENGQKRGVSDWKRGIFGIKKITRDAPLYDYILDIQVK